MGKSMEAGGIEGNRREEMGRKRKRVGKIGKDRGKR